MPYLTSDEAAELELFDAQAMQLAMESGIPVIVKNLCKPRARGTEITKTRDMCKNILISIMLKSNVTMLNIKSTRMLSQFGFLAKSFSLFENLDTFIDCIATSDGKISLVLVPSDMFQLELDNVVKELQNFAVVDRLQNRSVISLIGNAPMSPLILEKAFNVLRSIGVKVQMISQGSSSKVTKISLVLADTEAQDCVQALHSEFFENSFHGAEKRRPIPSTAPSSSGVKKRKAASAPQVQPEQPLGDADNPVGTGSGCEIEFDDCHGGDLDLVAGAPKAVQPEQPVLSEVAEGVSAPLGALDETDRCQTTVMDTDRSALDHALEVISRRMFDDDDDDLMTASGENAVDPFRYFAGVPESEDYQMFVGVNDGLLDVEDYPIDTPMLVRVNDGGYSAGLVADMPNVEAEQQGVVAAESSSRLGTEEEEVIETLLAEMPCPAPAFDSCESELHVRGECHAAYCGRCMTEAMHL